MSDYKVIHGDCLEVMATMEENSVDSIVTDSPYGLGFMGKHWDHGVPGVEFWQAALTVAKPGAHLLAFGGTRTFHRLAVAIEDAGWELRDTVMYVYGKGFPKCLDVSKNIDKFLGQQGQYGDYKTPDHAIRRKPGNLVHHEAWQRPWRDNPEIVDRNSRQYLPASEDAKKWKGWNTALKPAWEPILVARKPLTGTVAQNVLQWGTGAINVDGCRVPSGADYHEAGLRVVYSHSSGNFASGDSRPWILERIKNGLPTKESAPSALGRWPANLIHDGSDEVIELFPRVNNAGSAARFFYCAKASKADREEGCEHLPLKMAYDMVDREEDSAGLNSPRAGAGRTSGAHNHHPTVKPTSLMAYLCRLVTPPNGVVLDPFCGSGSTGKAAILEGFRFVGIEKEEEYIDIAKARIEFALKTRGNNQIGLFDE